MPNFSPTSKPFRLGEERHKAWWKRNERLPLAKGEILLAFLYPRPLYGLFKPLSSAFYSDQSRSIEDSRTQKSLVTRRQTPDQRDQPFPPPSPSVVYFVRGHTWFPSPFFLLNWGFLWHPPILTVDDRYQSHAFLHIKIVQTFLAFFSFLRQMWVRRGKND